MNTAQSKQKTAKSLLMPSIAELLEETFLLFWKKFLNLLILYTIAFIVYLIFLFFLVTVLYGQGFEAVLSFTGLSPILSAFHNTKFVYTAGVLFAAWLVFTSMFVSTFFASYIFMLHDAKEEASILTYIARGSLYVGPIIGLFLIGLFLLLGGSFLFIVPGIIIGFFLIFIFHTAVLDNKHGVEAVQMSISMVNQHRKKVFYRLLLLIVLLIFQYLLIRVTTFFFSDIAQYSAYIHFAGIIVLFWFGMTYSYVFYNHIHGSYNDVKKVSMKWVNSIAFTGWFIGIVVLVQLFQMLQQNNVFEITVQALNTGSKIIVSGQNLLVIEPPLAGQTMHTINILRASEDNLPFDQDVRLCAFADRRLHQFEEAGGFDGNQAYREDISNKDIWNNYLSGFSKINSLHWEKKGYQNEAEVIVDAWNKENITEPDIHIVTSEYSHACVQENDEFVVLMMGDYGG